MFNAEKVTEDIIKWIQETKETTKAKGFVLGISGGKDSATVAGLLCRAIGKENVIGVMMPNGHQPDINDSKLVCDSLGFNCIEININESYSGVINEISKLGELKNPETKINIAPRIRMTVLYAIAQEKGYLVCGTGNKSEEYIGYCTKWGDTAFDINPILNLTTDEVVAVGEYLGLPKEVIHKDPSDGLSGMTDEAKIGFSYDVLNEYIKTGVCKDEAVKQKIDTKHKNSRHKFQTQLSFKYNDK